MNNWLKRSLSLLLALVMVLGILPMGIQVKAAADNLHEADGIIWLTKNEAGDSASQAFIDKVYALQLDDMIRESLGITDSKVKVRFDGVDINNVFEIAQNQDVLTEFEKTLKEAVKNHELVDFTVDGAPKKIAFRSIDGVKIVIDDDNQIVIESEGEPADLTALVNNALNNPKIVIAHNGIGDLDKTGHTVTTNKNAYSWPKAGEGDVVAGTITVTVVAADTGTTATETAQIILRDTRKVLTHEYYDRNVLVGSFEVYEDEAAEIADPTRTYYTFEGWSEVSKDDENGLYKYEATWKAVNDEDGDNVANEEEVFTVTYKVNGEVYKTYENVLWGTYTPSPADPEDTAAGKFAGWGNVAAQVYEDAVYEAVFSMNPVVVIHVRYQTTVQEQKFFVVDGKANNPPAFPAIGGYYCTGLYYYAGSEKVAIADLKTFDFDANKVDGAYITDLYIDYYTDKDNNGLEDGTAENPWFVYKYVDVNGISIETVETLKAGYDYQAQAPDYAPKNWIITGWEITETADNVGTIIYTVSPIKVADANNNGRPDDDENDELILNMPFDITFVGDETAAVSIEVGSKLYQGTITITGLMEKDGKLNFSYDHANTKITATPLWLNGDASTGEMLYYVEDITVNGDSVVGGWENYNAKKPQTDIALLSSGGVALEVVYAEAKLVEKGDDGEYLMPGMPSYTEKEVYEEAISAPTYDAEAVTVKYLARKAGTSVTVDLNGLYDALADLIPEEYMDMAKDKVGESVTVTLDEKWLEIEESPAKEQTAQKIADDFFAEVIADLEESGFDAGVMSEMVSTLKDDLKARLQANAAVRKFGDIVPDPDAEYDEYINVTYTTEKYTVTKENVGLIIVDLRTPIKLTAADMTRGYRCFTDDDLLKNVVVKNAETDEVITGLELDLDRSYEKSGVTSEPITVTVSFAGNEQYQKGSVSFKLTVTKVKPVVTIPNTKIVVMNGVDYYDDAAPVVTPESATIFHVIAGIEANELAFDSNLVIKDDEFVVKAWVKIPDLYAQLVNDLKVNGKTIKTGQFMNIEELENLLEDYAANSNNPYAKEINQLLGIVDEIPEALINRLGLEDRTYTLQVRLDTQKEEIYPTEPGLYVNFAASTAYLGAVLPGDYGALFANSNYDASDPKSSAAVGIIVISPMVAIPNDNGVQLYDGEISNAQNVFVYEYTGEKIPHALEVAVNGVKLEGAEPFYYGLTTRLDATQAVPTMPGVYVAGYNHMTTEFNEDTQEYEVRRLGSDSCIIIIKQRPADMTITGGTFKYTGENILPKIEITDKNGNLIKDSGMTIISGTVNVNTEDGENVSTDDLYGTINIDFPDALQNKWDEYCKKIWGQDAPESYRASDVISFLKECGDAAANASNGAIEKFQAMGISEALDKALEAINKDTVDLDGKAERAQNLLTGGKEYYDNLIAKLEPLAKTDNNLYVTFYDLENEAENLPYHKTGAYLYAGVITDPDLTIDAAKGLVIIKSAEDYEMEDTHVAYNGEPQNIIKNDGTCRGDVVVVLDRADDSMIAISKDGKEVHIQVDPELAEVICDELNAIFGTNLNGNSGFAVGTVYTKTEAFADKLTTKIMAWIESKAVEAIKAVYPAGSDELAKALDKLETKMDNLTVKVSNKLQELDNLDNGTKITINGLIPEDLGTYNVTTFDFNVNEVNIVLDGDMFKAVKKVLAAKGYELNEGSDGYVITGYEKAEALAEDVTNAVFDEIARVAKAALENLPFDSDIDYENALDELNAKLLTLESKLFAKLQTVDGMDNYTRIVINGELPVNVGTYEFYGYDYDVAAARGTLTIHPVTITVAFDEDYDYSKVVGESDPDLKATAKITYTCEATGLNTTEWPTADAMADVFSYDITREAGEEVGTYPMTITADLLGKHATSGNYIIEVAEDEDFEILSVGTIGSGKATLSLEGEVFIEYMPAIEGFDGIDLTGKGGIAIWTGEGKPASSSLIWPDAENCVTMNNMYWSDQFDTWAVTTTGIPAKEYGDLLYFRAFIEVSEGVYITGPAAWYSPEMYCEDKLTNSTDMKLKEVCASLLEYGTAAQEYFDYNLDALVNDGWDFSEYDLTFDEAMIDELDPVHEKTGTLTGEKMYVGDAKATLTLEGAIVVEVVYPNVTAEDVLYAELLVWNETDYNATEDFSYDAATYTYKVPLVKGTLVDIDGYVASLKYQGKDGRYAGIPAKEIGDTVYFAAYVVTENGIYRSGMGRYSPDYYARQMLGHSDLELVSVVKAMAVYSEKARAYFNY